MSFFRSVNSDSEETCSDIEDSPSYSDSETEPQSVEFEDDSQLLSEVTFDLPDRHSILEELRKDNKNVYNRLKSVLTDAEFVEKVAEAFPKLPLVANERCGTWYVRPQKLYYQTVYFKSTDGHTGKWNFNLRRMNLHLLDIIEKHNGCILVDSTRRGKRVPDSLSKTVPIWCCVVNNAIHRWRQEQLMNGGPDSREVPSDWDLEFHSLPSVISASEHSQICERIPSFVDKLMVVPTPLRPLWFTPQSQIPANPWVESETFHPVLCLSASRQIKSAMEPQPGYMYIQGAADDHECWAMGLTPSLFWEHHEEILTDGAATCERRVQEIVASAKNTLNNEGEQWLNKAGKPIQPPYDFIKGTVIAIGSRTSGRPPQCWSAFNSIINCCELEYTENLDATHQNTYLHLNIPEGKKGQATLLELIPKALEFAKQKLAENQSILVHCAQGKDRSVGIALAIMVHYYDRAGNVVLEGVPKSQVTKELIQRKLLQIIESHPTASPSRATLKKINTFFMCS
ncbi:initiator tRNA phosphoribosyl transferase [Basidiobolus meristosporus CBS 931.73]|uniref:Initiator tRNA phosphoribosyl transferase n=1 Tax=Basidiobolus meristosporus CBS 931.73 TaxID=1314790 RepID=A0A1Y1X8F5_9FUNG|nr:initiator tRNA phosphoribosyl transferase [Basidiobolus meristosporus CBS 931.73]|eukprot:ORX82041.1 initiator tRNA phosphoribosyl transferase [Basidiobolus meristosporus CBS 931.73]